MGLSISKFSTSNHSKSYHQQLESHFKNIKPEYYVNDVVISEEDISRAKQSWTVIMSGAETPPFLESKASGDFNYGSVLTWFYDLFYMRFFQLSPEAELLFHNVSMVKQGRLIAGVISSALDSLKDPTRLRERLTANTLKHNGKGIKSEWYGTMGDSLIWTLQTVIGDSFDAATKLSWVRIYSFMLGIILPIAVEYEVNEARASSRLAALRRSISGKLFPSTARIEVSGRETGLWTRRRLDEFMVGSLLRAQFISEIATSPTKALRRSFLIPSVGSPGQKHNQPPLQITPASSTKGATEAPSSDLVPSFLKLRNPPSSPSDTRAPLIIEVRPTRNEVVGDPEDVEEYHH